MRALAVIPAYNEASALPRVIEELRSAQPGLDLLVVDDSSEDRTLHLLPGLGVRWIRVLRRGGVGGAVRQGLRYAARHGYEAAVRLVGRWSVSTYMTITIAPGEILCKLLLRIRMTTG